MISRFALAASLVLVLAACGSPAEEADEPASSVTEPGPAATAALEETVPEVGETESPGAEPSETPSPTPTPTPTATASAAPAAAAKVAAASSPPASFAQCAVCHKTKPGETGIGPTLANVFGAKAGHVNGFKYSEAMLESGLTWNQSNLDRFLADPKAVVPGTTMTFGGVKDAAKRAEIIAYLKTL
ncbi:c-type cytochrome [Altererythrobacter soli]|uniref:C-type cytochrome n=1 Tax=Croceibacterium soli TaxID=1739690 RepID=A0A6I4UTJ5_9SPHN|nr:c-type cytochrome [Croceibacterium soli]MXP40455.1 c-type cytochrome [Croceibacterium soli]